VIGFAKVLRSRLLREQRSHTSGFQGESLQGFVGKAYNSPFFSRVDQIYAAGYFYFLNRNAIYNHFLLHKTAGAVAQRTKTWP